MKHISGDLFLQHNKVLVEYSDGAKLMCDERWLYRIVWWKLWVPIQNKAFVSLPKYPII